MLLRVAHWLALLLTLLSGLASALAFPPWNLRPFAFVCLVPLFVALGSGSTRRSLLLVALWAIEVAWLIASPFPKSIAGYFGQPYWFGWLAGNLVFLVTAAIYYLPFAAIYRAAARRPSLFTPWIVACAWIAIELARGRLLTGSDLFVGNPWGLIGYTHTSGAIAQIASVAGVYGISFVLVSVNAGIAGVIGTLRRSDASAARSVGALGLAVLPAVASGLLGGSILRAAAQSNQAPDFVAVAAVQGNVANERRWRSDLYGKNLELYIDLTREAVARTSPRTVIWPESAMTFFLEAEPRLQSRLADLLRAGNLELLAGGPSAEGDRSPPYYNSVFQIGPEGRIRQRYDKEVLVPFAEFVPLTNWHPTKRRFDGVRTFAPGARGSDPFETRLGRVGTLVCNEAMLPEVAGRRVQAGAEVLINPSNDGWIEGRAFSEHMLAVAGLRAIEQRRYLIRASTSGPSAVVDPWGRVQSRTPPASRTVLTGQVRRLATRSVYGRLGDAFALSCVLMTFGFLARLWLRSRREHQHDDV